MPDRAQTSPPAAGLTNLLLQMLWIFTSMWCLFGLILWAVHHLLGNGLLFDCIGLLLLLALIAVSTFIPIWLFIRKILGEKQSSRF